MSEIKQRTFDVQEYKSKVVSALERLQAEQKPGDNTGKGSKIDVLNAAKKEIKAALAKGYTPKQIAAAIQQDAFGILPKTITQLANESSGKPKRKTTKKTTSINEKQVTNSTFTITEDSKDL